jgi:hypothetical protein
MNKKAIFFLLTCLLLVASITYIICNKREQVPPILAKEPNSEECRVVRPMLK